MIGVKMFFFQMVKTIFLTMVDTTITGVGINLAQGYLEKATFSRGLYLPSK